MIQIKVQFANFVEYSLVGTNASRTRALRLGCNFVANMCDELINRYVCFLQNFRQIHIHFIAAHCLHVQRVPEYRERIHFNYTFRQFRSLGSQNETKFDFTV